MGLLTSDEKTKVIGSTPNAVQPTLPIKMPTGYKISSAIFAITALASGYGVYHFLGVYDYLPSVGLVWLTIISAGISFNSLLSGDDEKAHRKMLLTQPITYEDLATYDGSWITAHDTDNSSYWVIGTLDKRFRVNQDVYQFIKERTGRINDAHSAHWMRFCFDDFAHWRVSMNSKSNNAKTTLKWMENIIQGQSEG